MFGRKRKQAADAGSTGAGLSGADAGGLEPQVADATGETQAEIPPAGLGNVAPVTASAPAPPTPTSPPAPATTPELGSTSDSVACGQCGAPVPIAQRYCTRCGTRRSDAQVPFATALAPAGAKGAREGSGALTPALAALIICLAVLFLGTGVLIGRSSAPQKSSAPQIITVPQTPDQNGQNGTTMPTTPTTPTAPTTTTPVTPGQQAVPPGQ